MRKLCRRTILVSGFALSTAGCIGPSAPQNGDEPPPVDNTDEETFQEDDLEHVVDVAWSVRDHLLDAVGIFEAWEADSNAIDVEEFDALRATSRSLITDYERSVFSHEEALRESEVAATWEGDGEALADLLDIHESLLFAIETFSIDITNAGGDPDRLAPRSWELLEFVTETGPAIAEETEDAIRTD